MTITMNPKWQTDIPGEFTVLPGGKIDFGGESGVVTLPGDYLDFMRMSDGLGTRQRDAWFIAQFPEGPVILALASLIEMENVARMTNWRYAITTDRAAPHLPPGFAVIGETENRCEVLLGVDPAGDDFGKVFAWQESTDPWMEGENTRGLGLAAGSFTDFMNGLSAKHEL